MVPPSMLPSWFGIFTASHSLKSQSWPEKCTSHYGDKSGTFEYAIFGKEINVGTSNILCLSDFVI